MKQFAGQANGILWNSYKLPVFIMLQKWRSSGAAEAPHLVQTPKTLSSCAACKNFGEALGIEIFQTDTGKP
jgi:hypothetical protein